jgi:hypothetical protein
MAMIIPPDTNNRDGKLAQRAREIHAQACASVDAHTQARLAAARRNAITAARRPSHVRVWLPAAGAMAACALVAGVMFWRPAAAPAPAQEQQIASGDTDLPLDADARQMDLYQNLEFYQWLAQQPDPRTPPGGAAR